MNKRHLIIISLPIALFMMDIMMGSIPISLPEIGKALWGMDSIYSEIVWQFRLPKAITCILAGSALAVGGLQMQSLFRNPLAGPDVLGLTAGSSLLIALVVLGGFSIPLLSEIANSAWGLSIIATIGSGCIFLLIITTTHYIKNNTSILIIGIMMSSLTYSLIAILQYLSQSDDLQTFMIWSLGTVGGTNWPEILVLTIVVLIALGISAVLMKSLNGLLLGENYAKGLGINVAQSRIGIVLSTALLTGGVTAFCGPITFVGLAVPHLVRILMPTTNHKILLPSVMAGGASLLLLCDIIAQIPDSQVLPLNAVTSLIGAPVVIWIILKSKQVHV